MKLVSSKAVILKIARDLGLGSTSIPWQDMVEWIGEGLQHIGGYNQFIPKTATIHVENYKGKLPEDFHSTRPNPFLSYKIVQDTIQVAIQHGHVNLDYLAFPLDEEGFPLVPDKVQYSTALFWKVAMQLAIRGDLVNKELSIATCVSRWNWYCRQAGATGQLGDGQFAARFASLFTSRIPILTNSEQNFNVVNGSLESPAIPRVNYIPKQFTPTPLI